MQVVITQTLTFYIYSRKDYGARDADYKAQHH